MSTERPDGWLIFPDEFMSEFYKDGKRAAGFVDITDDGEQVLTCVWNESNYQQWAEQNPEPNYLQDNKNERIKQSKEDLSSYLENNPLQWTDGLYYNITFEKQQQLTSKIMAATLALQTQKEYDLTWNSTGDICKEWTLEELTNLAFAIDSRVTKLVSYQQEKEIEIQNCETQQQLDAIVIDYSEVEY